MLAWIAVGLIAGWLAYFVMKTRARQGMVMDLVVGIIRAFIGGWVLVALVIPKVTPRQTAQPLNIVSIITAFVGAALLLVIIRLVRRNR